MWRKQDEPRTTSPSQEVNPNQQVNQSATAERSGAQPRDLSPAGGHLTQNLCIKGEISGHEDLLIDGRIQGKISIENGQVRVGPEGRVAADVVAREIVVNGEIRGNIHGQQRVLIGRTGRVNGEVHTPRIAVEEGAEIRGSMDVAPTREARAKHTAPVGTVRDAVRPELVQAKESSSHV